MTAVVLIGPPGAGKTTVGKVLAKLLNLPFFDTDQMVEEQTGRQIGQIFVDQGESAFRQVEQRCVAEALAQAEAGAVVALGGGAVVSQASQAALLAGPIVVFLDVSAGLAARRVGLNAARPLLAVSPRKAWRDLMALRRPIYQRLAQATVVVDGLRPAQIAAKIAQSVIAVEPTTKAGQGPTGFRPTAATAAHATAETASAGASRPAAGKEQAH